MSADLNDPKQRYAQQVLLDADDVQKVTRLMFEWNMSPQQVIKQVLKQTMEEEFGEHG